MKHKDTDDSQEYTEPDGGPRFRVVEEPGMTPGVTLRNAVVICTLASILAWLIETT